MEKFKSVADYPAVQKLNGDIDALKKNLSEREEKLQSLTAELEAEKKKLDELYVRGYMNELKAEEVQDQRKAVSQKEKEVNSFKDELSFERKYIEEAISRLTKKLKAAEREALNDLVGSIDSEIKKLRESLSKKSEVFISEVKAFQDVVNEKNKLTGLTQSWGGKFGDKLLSRLAVSLELLRFIDTEDLYRNVTLPKYSGLVD